MANPYFSNLTEFLYVNRTKEGRSEGDYSVVKNFFKRVRLRDDIFQDLTFFTKFTVPGDDRPDNIPDWKQAHHCAIHDADAQPQQHGKCHRQNGNWQVKQGAAVDGDEDTADKKKSDQYSG